MPIDLNNTGFNHFLEGMNSLPSTSALHQLDMGHPTKYGVFFEDFLNFDFGDYPADSDAVALQYAITLDTELDYDVSFGGVTGDLILTTEGGDTEGGQWRLNASPFQLTAGKKTFFETKFKITATTVAQYSLFLGLSKNQTGTGFIDDAGTALAVDDAWGFVSYDGVATVDAVTRDNDVLTGSEGSIHTVVTAVYVTMSLYYDGDDTHIYVNGVKKGTLSGVHPTGDALTAMIHFKSQSVEAGVLNVDYIYVAVEK